MMRVFAWSFVPILSGSLGFLVSMHSPAPAPAQREQAPDTKHPTPFCYGGDSDLAVDIKPVRTIKSNGRERLVLKFAAENRRQEKRIFTHAITIADDRGKDVTPPRLGGARNIAVQEKVSSDEFQTPTDLPDGFYQVVVTAMSKADDGVTSATRSEFFFHIEGGTITPLTDDEWYSQSRVSKGVSA